MGICVFRSSKVLGAARSACHHWEKIVRWLIVQIHKARSPRKCAQECGHRQMVILPKTGQSLSALGSVSGLR